MQYGIPEIYEYEAEGVVQDLYRDIKYVLKVPIVNFIFRALANYPDFLMIGWEQVRANMLSINSESAATQLRFPGLTVANAYNQFRKCYDDNTLNQIKNIIKTFQYVNPKLLLIASAWSESLGNRPIVSGMKDHGTIVPGVLDTLPQINLIHIPHASCYVQQLLQDIAKHHQSFDVASDYRALANFPDFLTLSWSYLKPYLDTDEYTVMSARLLKQSIALAHENMPYPVTLNTDQLSTIYSPAEISGIMGLVLLFQRFLPGLIVEVEYMRRLIEPL